ncbi:recombinase family protein [uncultured Bacteroides sp.]|uniref:recombinase family protein n=1 Tax=uncultured Bacteroides sp. TaxID=162156 RepID=UPI002598E1D1|nr:recombinase family protein [uncultured Bacteroides sp.]
MKKFVSWRRVSTKKQEKSGLGLEAQKDIIGHFVNTEKGELIADFCEAYTGKDLNGCIELKKAIEFSKANDAILIIAKSDRFRNTIEALQIYDEMGEGKIYFCDLPHTDKFTLTIFFALAEREAMLISIRTKAALAVQKRKIEQEGGFISKSGNWCTSLGGTTTGQAKGGQANGEKRRKEAAEDKLNMTISVMLEDCQTPQDIDRLAAKLNAMGHTTKTGLPFTRNRLTALRTKINRRAEYAQRII